MENYMAEDPGGLKNFYVVFRVHRQESEIKRIRKLMISSVIISSPPKNFITNRS